ncbi:MAG: alpha-galactosidase [Patescibacteria group bacterium]
MAGWFDPKASLRKRGAITLTGVSSERSTLMNLLSLPTSDLDYTLDLGQGAACARFGLPGRGSWAGEASPEFAVMVDGTLLASNDAGFAAISSGVETLAHGAVLCRSILRHEGLGLEAAACAVLYPGIALVEKWCEVWNIGSVTRTVSRLDSLHLRLAPGGYTLRSYASEWAGEFAPREAPLAAGALEVRTGRSSNGAIPWFGLRNGEGGILTGMVAWPGNWIFRFDPLPGGGWLLSGGLHDWECAAALAPGETVAAPPVLLALAADGDWDDAAWQHHLWGRRHAYPRGGALARRLPVEWNHWWPYEDVEITGEVFKANVEAAAGMGVDCATLDAGWFGPAGETRWQECRGDWDIVNTTRFPQGIRDLAEHTHAKGMKFGLWCEIQAAAPKSALHARRPDLVARRDGESLGYVCLANPEGRRWALETLDGLITSLGLDWIKFDFNLDPGAGCNRTDHGHGASDGLYRHFLAYLGLIDEIRRRHPNVLLEACAGGGLCLNPAVFRHFDCTFLSDPDYPVHNLQVLWGFLDMAAPDAALHWCWSETRGVYESFDPRDPGLTPAKLDYIVRTGMLTRFGFSQRLPDLPAWVRERFVHHIKLYKDRIAPLVREARVHRLTGQPLRDGGGDRWCALEYLMPDGGRGALFVFRLPGAEPCRRIALRGLHPHRNYRLAWDGEAAPPSAASGEELCGRGIDFRGLGEEESRLVFFEAE